MSQISSPAPINLGFLTVLQEATGWLGGYLVTNNWGRPLEFRLTTAVQPNKIQAALYGPTLQEYLLAEVIGKTLVEKTNAKPDLVVTDFPLTLRLRTRIEIPVVAIRAGTSTADAVPMEHPRSPTGLLLPSQFLSDQTIVAELLERVDTAVDLNEPFARIREAISEARKMGASNRAA